MRKRLALAIAIAIAIAMTFTGLGSMIETKLPPQTALILKPQLVTADGYSNYKRVQ